MKLTKRHLRRIIQEEMNHLRETQNWKPLSAAHAEELSGPPRPVPKAVQTETDALIAIDALEYAFFDALKELGVNSDDAEGIAYYIKTTAELDTAIDNAVHDYKKQIDMTSRQ